MSAFHQNFKYLRTIGVSIFNTKSSTAKHFGPLWITLRAYSHRSEFVSIRAARSISAISLKSGQQSA